MDLTKNFSVDLMLGFLKKFLLLFALILLSYICHVNHLQYLPFGGAGGWGENTLLCANGTKDQLSLVSGDRA
jgi:hypothetical protein